MRTWSRTGSRTSVRTFDRTESGGLPPVAGDPYFNYTTLLLPGNGTNGAQNNTFLDSSTNAFSITRNGNTTQGTFSPFSQTGWGNYFDGTGDWISAPSNAVFDFSGDFTIELWFYATTVGVTYQGFCGRRQTAANFGPFSMGLNNAAVLFSLSTSGSSWALNSTGGTVAANTWNHVAFVRSGTACTAYLNGTSIITGTVSGALASSSQNLAIGTFANDGTEAFNGYISNFRVVKGTAVYTANFTPSTTPLTAISGTSLLTCQSNRFVDNSSNAFAITRNGDVSVQAFSPFNPTAAWSAATYGGSGYFDGSGDYLTVPYNSALDFGSSDFTVEGWVYSGNNGALYLTVIGFGWQFGAFFAPIVIQNNNGTLVLYASSNGSSWDIANGSTIGAIPLGSWNHFAVSRSGSSIRLFLNGALNTTITSSSALMSNASRNISIGAGIDGNYAFNGYISSLRVVKGTAVYTAAFTPPTAPLTAIANTSLLTNFTNAGIYDATSKNDLETVGNAQISTTQSKFGGSSISFDGTGDYLLARTTADLQMVSGNFTWECWFRMNSLPGAGAYQTLWSQRPGTANYGGPCVVIDSAGNILLFISNAAATNWQISGADSGLDISLNTWQHLALVRNGNSITLYKDGVAGTAATASEGVGTSGLTAIGAGTANGSQTVNGYIQDLRITKGYARYTAAFTPPTTAFPVL